MTGGKSQMDRVLIATFSEKVSAYWQAEDALMQARLDLHHAQIRKTQERLDRIAESFGRLA